MRMESRGQDTTELLEQSASCDTSSAEHTALLSPDAKAAANSSWYYV